MHHTHRACRSLLALNAARQLELLATPVVSRGLLLCFRFTRAFVSFRQRSSSFAFSALPAHAVRMRMFRVKCVYAWSLPFNFLIHLMSCLHVLSLLTRVAILLLSPTTPATFICCKHCCYCCSGYCLRKCPVVRFVRCVHCDMFVSTGRQFRSPHLPALLLCVRAE